MKEEIDEILKIESKMAEEKQKAVEEAGRLKSQADTELNLAEKEIKNANRERIQDDLNQFRKELDTENHDKLEEYQKTVLTFDRLEPTVVNTVLDKLNKKICHSEF